MSRIGNLPIAIPKGVAITVNPNELVVKGPKGELTQDYSSNIAFTVDGDVLTVTRANDEKESRAKHGLYRSLANNMIIGVSAGFSKELEINGVGYRAEPKGNNLVFSLGYSTQIEYVTPEGVELKVDGKGNTKVIVSGIDKQKVGQCASEIVSLRPPEPYKGKGVKYADQILRRKVGKSGIK